MHKPLVSLVYQEKQRRIVDEKVKEEATLLVGSNEGSIDKSSKCTCDAAEAFNTILS